MRVIQLLTTMSYGDAVSNEAIALYNALHRAGYSTGIYAENIDSRLPWRLVKKISKVPKMKDSDIIIYHLSTGTPLNFRLPEYHGRKILRYHNITPYGFFEKYSNASWKLCKSGEEGLKFLADKVEYCVAASEYNKKDLQKAGYACRVDVLPVLIPLQDYSQKPDDGIVQTYKDEEYTNLLFTGRIAPNKKQEDVISTFYMYQKYYNDKSRLFIVGSYKGMEKYYQRLQEYVQELGVQNVYFTGHVKFEEILAYYTVADLFLCMSEHEGFCVPLVEAMRFQVPVVAYDSSAVTDTLGGAGILIEDKNPLETAGVLDYIVNHPKYREALIGDQNRRLQDFSHDRIEQQFFTYLNDFLKGKNEKDSDC